MTEITFRKIDDFQFEQDVQEVQAIVRELRDGSDWELENGGDAAKSARLGSVADALVRMLAIYKRSRLSVVAEQRIERCIDLSRWG